MAPHTRARSLRRTRAVRSSLTSHASLPSGPLTTGVCILYADTGSNDAVDSAPNGYNGTQTVGFGVPMTQGTHTIGPLNVATASVTIGQQTWNATSFQGSCSVIITTLTSNRAVGTFSFTANGVTPGATPATRQITSGQFDVTF